MAHPYNPLAPLTPRQLRRMALRYTRAQYGPVLSQINREYATRAQAGRSAIEGSTAQFAAALGQEAPRTHAIYGQAQSAQSGIDSAIAQRLAAAGIAAQADVGGQLQSAGITPTMDLAQTGARAGAASFGIGSAALSRLVAEGAARENYASRLPGIARLGGAQRGQDLALQLESGRQRDVGTLRSKIPGTVVSIEQQLQQNEFNKAAARLSFQGTLAGVQQRGAVASVKATQASLNANETNRHNVALENAKQAANNIAYYKAHHPGVKSGAGEKAILSTRNSMFTQARGYSTSKTPPPYKGAFRRLFLTYNMPLRVLGLKQPQIEALIQQALAASGYTRKKKSSTAGGGGYRSPSG